MESVIKLLDLSKKPMAKKKDPVKIVIPDTHESVDVKVEIVDRRSEEFNRDDILNDLKELMVVKSSMRNDDMTDMNKDRLLAITEESKETDVDDVDEASDADEASDVYGGLEEKGVDKMSEEGVVKETVKTGKSKIRLKPPKINIIKPSIKKIRGTVTALNTGTSVKRSTGHVIKIGDLDLTERVWPKKPVVVHRANAYFMNNRKRFISFINSLYRNYKKDLKDEEKDVGCDKKRGSFSLMTHQSIVRDYINLYSPYRGLLIYHGLGAGKTCSSIAIAEGIKTENTVIIMTPASLRDNYLSELKTCGDDFYRFNQYWEFIKTGDDEDAVKQLSGALNLPIDYIIKRGGAWFVDMNKKSNFDKLSTEDQESLNEQLNTMISTKYRFINYNGLRMSSLSALTNEGSSNPFDNKVVIVDEAHNFVSRIVNKIKNKKSLSYKLYEYLMSATNCKIVFLTGTPIINYPNEIGVLFNILRGYIKTFNFTVNVKTRDKVNQSKIQDIFSKSLKSYDYINYNSSSKTIEITRNPMGFASIYDRETNNYKGVKRVAGKQCDPEKRGSDCPREFICGGENKCVSMSDDMFVGKCKAILRDNEIEVTNVNVLKTEKALPDTSDEFIAMFVDKKTNDIKNLNLFQKRVLGLTSYFRSAQESLMPRFDIDKDMEIIETPMSDYQFGLYEKAREGERDMEKRNAKKRKKSGADDDTVSTYRIFSRAFCNFVFPREIERPKPIQDQDLNEAILQEGVNEDDLDAISVDEKLQNIDGMNALEDKEKLIENQEKITDGTYADRIRRALKALKTGADEYLTPESLQTYSPKFLSMLSNILDEKNSGLHLIYSQFRTLEGIGILSLILQQNGFVKFKIKKDNKKGQWFLDMKDEDLGKPAFALYTGTEEKEEKEIIRNIYNGTWEKVPSTILEKIRGVSKNNDNGELIKIFMITSSGAEGINLKNTRFVHITEPYWHPVRMEQVIGRARRICSHNSLPVELQNVKVFVYLMTLSENQMKSKESGGLASQDLLQKDVSKLDKKTPFTSDQTLWEISNMKQEINKNILRAVKSTSIDCALHSKSTDKEPIVCMSYGDSNPNEFTTEPLLSRATKDKEQKMNVKYKKVKYQKITFGGITYALKRFKPHLDTKKAPEGELYDYDSFLKVQESGVGEPVLVGYLRIKRVKGGKLKVVFSDT